MSNEEYDTVEADARMFLLTGDRDHLDNVFTTIDANKNNATLRRHCHILRGMIVSLNANLGIQENSGEIGKLLNKIERAFGIGLTRNVGLVRGVVVSCNHPGMPV